MLKEFKIQNPLLDISMAWGGGHTTETDPFLQGWRIRKISPTSAGVLCGRRGIEGCFSVMPLSDGKLDVALYDETPERIGKALREGPGADAKYVLVPCIPGWALGVLEELEEYLKD